MKAIIVIEIDEKHLLKEMNELYDRLNGYKCELIPMPEKKAPSVQFSARHNDEHMEILGLRCTDYEKGWNACLDSIIGENNCLDEITGETE